MASPTNLLRYSKELALKLHDPVNSGEEDGKFSAELRFGYLTRGFGKLIRNLESIKVDVEYIYPALYNIIVKTFITDPPTAVVRTLNGLEVSLSDIHSSPVFKIFKVFASNADTTYRGNDISVLNFFDVINGVATEHYDKTKLNKGFFYCLFNGVVRFAAKTDIEITSLQFLIKNPIPKYSISSEQDLIIPTDYEDLFLSNAALEAAIDDNNMQAVNLYRSEINTELKLLIAKRQLEQQINKTNVTDNG